MTKKKTHRIFLVPSVTMTKKDTETQNFEMWIAKVEFGALAQAISGMDLQLRPPTWLLLLVAMSPAHILGLIYLADKVWTLQPEAVKFCRTWASSESQTSSQGIFLPFRHLRLQADPPVLPIPLMAVGPQETSSELLPWKEGREERKEGHMFHMSDMFYRH